MVYARAQPLTMLRRAPILALLATSLWPRLSAATPQDLFGYGPRASAMGGTGAALR